MDNPLKRLYRCWRRNVGDSYADFSHCHPLETLSEMGYQHYHQAPTSKRCHQNPEIVTNIRMSPTLL